MIAPRLIWNLGLMTSLGAVIALLFFGNRATSNGYWKVRLSAFLFSATILVFYALLNFGGLFALGGRASGIEQVFLLLPVLTPFIMCICLISVSWAAITMWAAFIVLNSVYWSVSHWSLHVFPLLRFEWPLWIACLLLTIVAAQEKARNRSRNRCYP